MKLIKRIGAILVTVAMLCTLLVFVPTNVTTRVHALEEAGLAYNTSGFQSLGCDLSFYNVSDNNYANGYSNDDSGANYSLVDFEAMKADGCDFAILRLGSEDSSGKYYDPHFVTYYNMAREAGMYLGVYYYSYATTYAEAVEEAEFCIEVMESYGMYFEYPIYIDIEESDQMSSSVAPNVSLGWCDTMEAAGYFPGIYGNYNLYDCLTTDIQQNYDIWLAYVSSATSTSSYNPSNTDLSDECSVWQYSFYGYEYDGIGLDMLDVNVSYKDYPTIMATYGYNNVDGSGATKTNLSKNATYYPPDNTRTDEYADDGSKLTDGSKGSIYGGETARYSGWYTTGLEIVIDLGSATDSNTYNVYSAANSSWGIGEVSGFTVSVSDSLDGPFTQVGATTTVTTTGSETTYGWSTQLMTITTDTPANARYVKFTISPDGGTDGGHVWLDEVEVIYDSSLVDDEGGSDPEDPEDPEDPTDTVITSIELVTTGSTVAGNTMFAPAVYSINGDTSLVASAASSLLVQWWNEDASSMYTTGTDVLEAGVTYDLYIKLTCDSTYSFSDSCVMTLTTADGTLTGEYYASTSDATNRAYDFMITSAEAGTTDPEDPEEPVEKFVINSLEFVTTANSPALNGTVFVPTLVSVNGDTSLVNYVKENHSIWYTFYNYEVEEYTESTFGLLNIGYKYDLYTSITAADDAEFSSGCTFTLTTANGVHTGISYENTTSAITFDIYFQTETVSVEDQTVYITGFNTSIVAGAAQIFTPDFGTVSSSTANITWTMNAIAKYDEKLDAYVVTQVFAGGGDSTLSYELADDEIFIAVHDWETGVTDGTEVEGSAQNFANLGEVQVGMILNFTDIDLDTKTLGTSPTITFSVPVEPIVSLGAQANAELGGIRFGATYNKVVANGEVTGMGFLLISADKLGSNVLNLDYTSNSAIAKLVANVECRTIAAEDYVAGMAFEDYTSFTFYATVIGLGEYADEIIVAVPYITYLDGTVFYGETLSNSLNGVLNGNSSF